MAVQQDYRRRRIGEILLSRDIVSQEQLDSALAAQKGDHRCLGTILMEMGVVDRGQMAAVLAEQRRDIPEIGPEDLQHLGPQVAGYIPETLARRFNVIAVKRDDTTLTVAMADTGDLAALDLLGHVTKSQIEPVRAPGEELAAAIEHLYGQRLAEEDAIGGQSLEAISLEVESGESAAEDDLAPTDLMASAEDAPVVRFVEVLFRDAVNKRSSDVHLEPGEQTTNVRIRVDGVLQRLLTISSRMHPAVVSRIKILSGLNIAERRLPQDGRCRLKFRDRQVDVRVSTLPSVYGEKVVMRLLDKSQNILSMEDMGLADLDLQRVKEALASPYGMILLTGPTGSGKTTSLYAGLTFLNEPTCNIITVEDPVEYELAGITQVQVKPDIGLTFARCLRHILRQDPDTIMIGEMRDIETAQMAVRAALTGHLVLSTLHTNNAPAVVSRLVDIGIPGYLITASLNMAIAQRLVRRLCAGCKEPYDPPPEVMEQLGWDGAPAGATIFRGVGCAECDYTGYLGRVGLYEVMPITTRLRQVILKGGREDEVRGVAREEGMRGLYDQGLGKVCEGVTSIEEVLSIPPEDTA